MLEYRDSPSPPSPMVLKMVLQGASEMAQEVKVPTVKPDDLGSIPRIHMVERENLTSACTPFQCPSHAHTFTQNNGVIFTVFNASIEV